MKKNVFKRGFKAVKQEQKRQEEARKARKGRLWRVFFPKEADDDFEIPFTFLTGEPITFYEHTENINGKMTHSTCTGEDCKKCGKGNKARFVGAFLGIDHTVLKVDERDEQGNKTGKKKTIKDRAKLIVRGQTDLAKLDRLANKYGLTAYRWNIAKTGTGTSSSWNFDRDEEVEYTDDEILNLLPDEVRERVQASLDEGMDMEEALYTEVEWQINTPEDGDDSNNSDDGDDTSDDEVENKVKRGVQNVDDEDDPEDDDVPPPKNKKNIKAQKAGNKASSKPASAKNTHKKIIKK